VPGLSRVAVRVRLGMGAAAGGPPACRPARRRTPCRACWARRRLLRVPPQGRRFLSKRLWAISHHSGHRARCSGCVGARRSVRSAARPGPRAWVHGSGGRRCLTGRGRVAAPAARRAARADALTPAAARTGRRAGRAPCGFCRPGLRCAQRPARRFRPSSLRGAAVPRSAPHQPGSLVWRVRRPRGVDGRQSLSQVHSARVRRASARRDARIIAGRSGGGCAGAAGFGGLALLRELQRRLQHLPPAPDAAGRPPITGWCLCCCSTQTPRLLPLQGRSLCSARPAGGRGGAGSPAEPRVRWPTCLPTQ